MTQKLNLKRIDSMDENSHTLPVNSAELPFGTVVELLIHQKEVRPNKMAFTFLLDGESQEQSVSYSQLLARSMAVAHELQTRQLTGRTVLIQMESGLEFLYAFFGCLCAGAIAVPSHPHRSRRTIPRLRTIVKDSELSCVLSTSDVALEMQDRIGSDSELEQLNWIAVDKMKNRHANLQNQVEIGPKTTAFLQYTSGSTAAPKGVIVSHQNIIANELMMQQAFGHNSDSLVVSWLPLFHDMGLIGNVLQSLYLGSGCVLMSPRHFLEHPVRWLRAISKYDAQMSGGPNFAFDLCADRVTDDELSTVDLSSWRNAFNGAEPIRASTLKRFSDRFEANGFRPEFHYPCYGLAEATLFVTGGENAECFRTMRVNTSALEQNCVQEVESKDSTNSREVVSCGKSWHEQEIAIVDPESHHRTAPNRIGEIWVSGPHVCQGYWRNTQATADTFQARICGESERIWMRTGDLGFMNENDLFVTGRMKDMMIIRGRNHYPQDIELTSETAHSSFRPGGSAAFSIDFEGEEHLVIIQEVRREERRSIDTTAVIQAIRRDVTLAHELQAQVVLLCNPGTVPKTSSGKVQRKLARQRYLAGEIPAIIESKISCSDSVGHGWSLTKSSLEKAVHADEQQMLLEALLCVELQRLLRVSPTDFDYGQSINGLGLDDVSVASLLFHIREELEVDIAEATLLCGIRVPQLASIIRGMWNQIPSETLSQSTQNLAELKKLVEKEIVSWLNQETKFNGDAIDHDSSFSSLGLDSLGATSIAVRLQNLTGKSVSSHHVYEFQTVDSLARYLTNAAPYTNSSVGESTPRTEHEINDIHHESMVQSHSDYYRQLNHRFDRFRENDQYYFQTEIEHQNAGSAQVGGKKMLMMASYSYLGLLNHPDVNKASIEAIHQLGTGTHGARLLAGTTMLHRELEHEIASFVGAEDALAYSSGFMANLSTIASLVGAGDLVVGDVLNHASIADGCKFSEADFLEFRHHDVAHLDMLLSANPARKQLVVVDAVYSMDGDTAPLPEIVKVCQRHHAMLMVDEAHSFGVLGQTGRGVQEYFNLPNDAIDIKMGTLSKAVASGGGFIAAKREIIDYLKHHARGFMFSGALPAPQVAAARACLKILRSEPFRVAQLQRNASRFANGLRAIGLNVPATVSPIVPVIFESDQLTLEFTGRCRDMGLFVVPVFYPAVPMDQPRIRTSILASHSDDDIDFALDVFAKVKNELIPAHKM